MVDLGRGRTNRVAPAINTEGFTLQDFVVSVIVPTYNEVENIADLIDALHDTLQDLAYEIIVVDDDSEDETWRVAQDHSANDPRVRVIRRFEDRGLSSAVLTGMSVSEGRTLAVMDADFQHDESILPKMVETVTSGEAEICVGTRSGEGGSYGRWSRRRRLASWIAATLARLLLPVRTSDPMSGYFVVSRSAYERLAPGINPRGFKILLEFIGRADDLRITELGYSFRTRRRGETKLSGAIVHNYLIAILDLRFGRHVSAVFLMYCLVGLSGVVVALTGFGLGELADLPHINLGITPGLNPIYLSVLVGIQLSIISNFIGNNYLTFYEDRYRGWGLLRGFTRFEAVSLVGLIVQVSIFQFLDRSDFPTAALDETLAATINNGIGIAVATVGNFFLYATITWNQRGRSRRFSYG